jgi:5-(carboxyamino)imidazole ribonucleotide synthase
VRVGVLGGGQLGRMLGLAGVPLGLRFRFLDPMPDAPAAEVGELVTGHWSDAAALERFARGVDVVTYEFENVPAETVRRLAERVPVRPGPLALETARDRLREKRFFAGLGVPTAPFAPVDGADQLADAAAAVGLPAVLKTRQLGYDGKGQRVVRRPEELEPAWRELGGVPQILEAFVSFRRELSILGVRGVDGDVAFYPPVENHHHLGILDLTLAPAPALPPALVDRAEAYARAALEALDYAGVLAIELFDAEDGLLVNEMAPRVHNSGHWSIEGAVTSQFENHLRAILGWPLGPTAARCAAGMVNLVGEMPPPEIVLAAPGARLHSYGKVPRPGRKLGHVTVLGADEAERDAAVAVVRRLVAGERGS